MKIMMLHNGHDFPPDIRLEKEIRALKSAGHQVIVVCENRKSRPQRESWNGITIIRLPRLPLLLRRINTATLFLTLHSPLWEHYINKIVRAESPDVLHVHDLPFVGPGLRIAHRFNLPLVADLHENFPALLRIRQKGVTYSPFDSWVFNPERFERYESQVLPKCDRIIVVVKEAAERVKMLGIEPSHITIVGNTEDIAAVETTAHQTIDLPASALTLLYVGGFGPNRGLETAIRAMPKIITQIPTAQLVIVGDGPDRVTLENLTQQLEVAQAVRFEGWQKFDRVHSYIQASDVCLVPHIANPHTNATIPHKLFQYMYMGKPVLVSSAKPLARIVQQTQAGLVFESDNSDDFSRAVCALHDETLREKLGATGKQAVESYYNWQVDTQQLLALYKEIDNQKQKNLQ